jgi:hypothetical protein
MSRDPFSYDPQDTLDPSRRPAQPQGSARPDPPGGRNSGPEAPAHPETTEEAREQDSTRDERGDTRRAYYVRDRAYLLRPSELHSLKELGKFRVIAATDLAEHAYGGDRGRMEKDTRRLVRESLVTDQTIEISQKRVLRLLTLTKGGHRLLNETKELPDDQATYHGLVNRRDAKHDADLYRLYHREAARIEGPGSRPVRVILDYELRRGLNRDLAMLGPDRDDPERKSQVAEKHGLKVVNGRILVPDLRLEYQTPEFELRHVDLELATRDYKPRALVAKARAGFSLYSRFEDASRLRRILDEHELTAGILTL